MKTTTVTNKTFKDIKPWYYINSDITEKNFPWPKEVQTKGWKVLKMDTSYPSQGALDRIKTEGLRPATIHELALFAENHPEEFPDKTWTGMAAFGTDFTDSGGDRRVPFVYRHSDGDWRFGLGRFEGGWDSGRCLLCFCDKENLDTQTTEIQNSDSLTLERAISICKENGLTVTRVY